MEEAQDLIDEMEELKEQQQDNAQDLIDESEELEDNSNDGLLDSIGNPLERLEEDLNELFGK